MEKTKLRVKFVDFAKDFNTQKNTFTELLDEFCNLEISDDPEIVFYSVFGSEHLKYSCVRVFYTGECETCDFNICDYAIGFDYMEYGDRYLRVPLFALFQYANQLAEVINAPLEYSKVLFEREFCSFVYSNYNAIPIREQLLDALNKRERVASGGRYLNNIGEPVADKHDFLRRYKFNIAVENCAFPGYTTEKIMQAFQAKTVPIYYGDPLVVKDFNPSTFINVADFPSVEEAAEYVVRAANDEEIYMSFFAENPFNENSNIYLHKLSAFLKGIVCQNPKERYRRPLGTRQTFYEERTRKYAFWDKHCLQKIKKLENAFRKINKKKTIKR